MCGARAPLCPVEQGGLLRTSLRSATTEAAEVRWTSRRSAHAPPPPGARDLSDALRRRCIYHWIDYPDFAKELEIVRRKAPRATAALAAQVVAFVQTLRNEPLYKAPGLSEALDWIAALLALDAVGTDAVALTSDQVDATLGTLLKYRDDVDHARTGLTQLLSQALRAMP